MAKENFDKAPDCFKVRYDGERAEMEFLVEKYRLGDFLDLADGVKSSCLSSLVRENGKPLSPVVFPRLYRVARQTLDRLGLDGKCEIYLWPDAKQPMADWVNGETENTFLFCVTTAFGVECAGGGIPVRFPARRPGPDCKGEVTRLVDGGLWSQPGLVLFVMAATGDDAKGSVVC